MNLLKAMEVFIKVAELRGFAPAARALSLSTSSVSRQVQDFENWIGTQLLRRTTRHLSLTEMGETQLENCRRVVNELHAMRLDKETQSSEPSGELRVTAPQFIAKRLLADLLPAFLASYPKISLDLVAIDREVDLVDEGYDLALRIGILADSTLRARKLCNVSLFLVASPGYLDKHGIPTTVRELNGHNCIVDTIPEHAERWPLSDVTLKKNFRATGNIRVNSGEIVETMVLQDAGIAYLPNFFVAEHIAEGRMVRLLDDAESPTLGMYLVYPQTRQLAPKTRVFIDYVTDHVDKRITG